MNCEEVQKYLSDLLDESLEVERSQKVSDHLTACALCSEEMASLAECQRLVSGLPAVEPPVGFSNRVMAHVREAARKPNLWERMFSPLRIKIPLQATAVVLIAVLAAYIYQKEPLQRESVITAQPEKFRGREDETDKLASIAAQAPAGESKTTRVPHVAKPEFKDSAQLREPQPLAKPVEQNKGTPGRQLTPTTPSEVRSPATLAPAPLPEKSSPLSKTASSGLEQSSPPEEARAKVPQLQPTQPEKDNVSKDAAPTRESLSYAETRERSAASSLDALRSGAVVGVALPSDHELAIRLKGPARDDKAAADRLGTDFAQSERLSSMAEGESKNLDQARQRAIQTGQVQTIWITIARNQYEPFKTGLAELGSIETELSRPVENDAVSKFSDQLRIKITLFPPPVSGSPTPSQPSGR
jgi:Predicted integral membrane protein (DUF2275)